MPLVLIVALAIATPFISALVTRVAGRHSGWILAVPLALAAGVAAWAYEPGVVKDYSVSWMPALGVDFALQLDGLSFLFLALVLVIGIGVLIYSPRYLDAGPNSAFYFFITGFAAAMTLLVLADDVVLFYVAWELTTLCSFFLIAFTGGFNGRAPALRTLLVTVFGGLLLLVSFVIMVVTTGTTRISEILVDQVWEDNPGLLLAAAVLAALAAFTKSAQFPFQAWLPDSMAAISPVSAYLHAAAMVKAGIYVMFRFSVLFDAVTWWAILLIGAGAFTAIFGAVTAVTRDDLKELLAYSTISQLGLITLTIGIGSDEALVAALVHTMAHAVFKAALFMAIGVVDKQAGTRNYSQLRTMRLKIPYTRAVIVLAAASMAGIPPLFGFVSKEMLLKASIGMDATDVDINVLLVTTIVVTSIFTFVYSLRLMLAVRPFAREDSGQEPAVVEEGHPVFVAVPVLLALLSVVLGIVPGLLNPLIADAGLAATGATQDPDLALWHGVDLALILTLGIIAVGAVIVARRDDVFPVVAKLKSPANGLVAVENIRSGIIDLGGYFSRISGGTSLRKHLAWPLIGVVLIMLVGLFGITETDSFVDDPSRDSDWVLTLVIALGVAAAMLAHTRLTMVVVISIVGLAMTLWFYALGAADVATTQLGVEMLTVVILVLVLHRLPARFAPESKKAQLSSLLLAAGVGLAGFLGVFALTGRREKSEAALYYLREGENATGGSNIVNTILVDFRALDTLGELTVLGVAGIVIFTMVYKRHIARPVDIQLDKHSPVLPPRENSIFLTVTMKVVGPLILLVSAVLFLRGHYQTGGGFVAALIAGAGVALMYLAAPSDEEGRIKMNSNLLIGSGIALGAFMGILGYLEGSFLTPFDINLGITTIPSTLLFDLGVYLGVLGIIVAAINSLGTKDKRGYSPDNHVGHPQREDPLHTRQEEEPLSATLGQEGENA